MAKLLLVDDDPDQLEVRALLMERAGHQVSTASRPDAALAACEHCRPEVVLMDLRLPRADDGLALIRQLRRRFPAVAIVVLSGLADSFASFPESKLVNRFFRKPVRSHDLLGAIQELA